jgi:transposase
MLLQYSGNEYKLPTRNSEEPELSLKDREWICPDCKTSHDRDINAAINIKKFSLLDQNLIIT